MHVCSKNHLLKPADTVESNLIKRMPVNVLCNIQILLVPLLSESVGSGGNSDLIPCNTVKDFCKVSLISSPCDTFCSVQKIQSKALR